MRAHLGSLRVILARLEAHSSAGSLKPVIAANSST
jgi:hypothetical protein